MYNNKKIGLILPTRYGSSRLNGKVLCPINGKLQIERIIDRAEKSKYLDSIILAITDKKDENEQILDWYSENNNRYKCGFSCYLEMFVGDHNNIIKRCLNAAIKYDIDIIVDISHDETFFDPGLCDLLIERLFQYNADYSANCITRSFANGFDIQVYTREIYQKVYDYLDSLAECLNGIKQEWKNYWSGWNLWHYRECLWPKPRFVNLEAEPEYYYPHWNLCLDNEDDKKLIESICRYFERTIINHKLEKMIMYNELNYGYKEIINYLKNNQSLLKINEKSIPNRIDRQE